jgi:hypothetical protein
MKRWLIAALLLSAGCKRSRCEDIQAAPVAGIYKGGGSLGDERLVRLAVDTSGKKVVLTYAMMDGSRIRATYRVSKKSKQR